MSKFNKTKEWLIEEYIVKNRSRKDVAAECGLTVAGLQSLLTTLDIKKEKFSLSKEKLETLVNQKLPHDEIEKILGIGQTTLYRYLKKYNLKILAEPRIISQYDDSNDMLMCQLYLDGFSSPMIAQTFGISHRTVLNHLIKCKIPIRNASECQWLYRQKTFPEELKSYDTVYDLYITQKLSKKDLGIKFNCDPCVIDRVLKSFEIPIRGDSESKKGLMTGEKHWNWKGGVTPLAMRLREYFGVNQVPNILKRDNYTCQLCGSHKELHVHHIQHFSTILQRILKENSHLNPITDIELLYNIAIKDAEFCDLNNLITYCKECHYSKIHGYNLKADNKSCELLESLEPES